MQFQNHSLTFILKKNLFFRLPALYLVHPWLTTLSLPWTSQLLPAMWSLANFKTDVDSFFLVQKTFPPLGCKTQSIQERWQQRVPTGPRSYNGRGVFNQYIRLRNQPVIAAKNFAREENLSPVLIPTMSKDMDEQFKLAHKVVGVVDRAKRKICVTLLRYNVDKPESSCAQV